MNKEVIFCIRLTIIAHYKNNAYSLMCTVSKHLYAHSTVQGTKEKRQVLADRLIIEESIGILLMLFLGF